jgi:hypothetical protein
MYQTEDDDEGRTEFLGSAMLYGVVAGGVAFVLVTVATQNILRGFAVGVLATVAVAGFMLLWAVPGLLVVGVATLVGRMFKRP